jgi:hypothetical protein
VSMMCDQSFKADISPVIALWTFPAMPTYCLTLQTPKPQHATTSTSTCDHVTKPWQFILLGTRNAELSNSGQLFEVAVAYSHYT